MGQRSSPLEASSNQEASSCGLRQGLPLAFSMPVAKAFLVLPLVLIRALGRDIAFHGFYKIGQKIQDIVALYITKQQYMDKITRN